MGWNSALLGVNGEKDRKEKKHSMQKEQHVCTKDLRHSKYKKLEGKKKQTLVWVEKKRGYMVGNKTEVKQHSTLEIILGIFPLTQKQWEAKEGIFSKNWYDQICDIMSK